MSTVPLIDYEDAGPEVRAVYDDIRATRKSDFINNFWKALANDPALLKRTWEGVRQVMGPGELDPLVKEMIYVAVSATNNCEYCIRSHTTAARWSRARTPTLGGPPAVVVAVCATLQV